LKLREHPTSHKPQKPTQQPLPNPPLRQKKDSLRQQKTCTSLNTLHSCHNYQPNHSTTGRQQQLSNLTLNLQAWQPLPHHSSTQTPYPPTSNLPFLPIRHP
jgi:hypothetical protein